MKKTKAHILVIDDDKDVLLSARMLLKRQYTDVTTSSDPREINSYITTKPIDILLLDMNFRMGINDGKEGLYWLKHVREINPEIIVILMTAYGEVKLAVEAIKSGAFDFILKPWVNEKLLATVHAGLELRRSKQKVGVLTSSNKTLEHTLENEMGPIIGTSPAMNRLMETLQKVSDTEAEILLLGENGTGKHHVAREIHRLSGRKKQPFIHVDLGAIAETLFEGELFGHKKGAFTDAKEDKAGMFELANGGTIFLDEIGNLSLNLQTKLLTVLQDRKITRLGEGIQRSVDVRFICATNAPLHQWVDESKFRQDLLFRINTIEIVIPPLRERDSDIPEFIRFYLKMYKEKYRKPNLRISNEAIAVLQKHKWPGNIRELQHIMERGVIMSDGVEIGSSDFNLVADSGKAEQIKDLDGYNLRDIEKLLVQKAIDKHNGNISKAAKELGITRAALYRRMEKFNL
ncbi:MAG: sigma-54-dependent Fis family transcriptional regulator [Bacteroidetes bacterium]|nr:sigma-54-dependent Fis family transcriptional regulator [Bacteroidota bacterium]